MYFLGFISIFRPWPSWLLNSSGHLSVGLGSPPPTSPPSSPPPQHHPPCSSRNGPSRRRRRARRQAAREAAATENVEAAVTENSDRETLTTEASVNAEPKSIDSAVQVDLPLKQDQLHILDRNLQHQHVPDVFCPDQHYQPAVHAEPPNHGIPQQDQGITLSQFQELVQTIGKPKHRNEDNFSKLFPR